MTDLTCAPCIKVRLNELEKTLTEMASRTFVRDDPIEGPEFITLLQERHLLRLAYRKLRPEEPEPGPTTSRSTSV